MILRIFVFYVGSVMLLALVLPYTSYSKDQSPFVTFFSGIGVPYAGDIIQVVILTAALSSLNAGLYATGRTLRSMAVAGEAPQVAARLNKHQVPAWASSSPPPWDCSASSSTPSWRRTPSRSS